MSGRGVMGDPIEDILARLDEERVLEGVERLVAIPSVSGEEDAISSHVARELVALGLEVTEQEVLPGRRNVLGALDTGRAGGRGAGGRDHLLAPRRAPLRRASRRAGAGPRGPAPTPRTGAPAAPPR